MLYNIDINKMNKLMSNNEDARQIIPQLLRNHRNTISTISHEIRNPLTLVSSALQVMEKQNPELKDIPRVKISTPNQETLHMRVETIPEGMATLEAIAHAMGVIEGEEVKEKLLQFYRAKLEETLKGRGIKI